MKHTASIGVIAVKVGLVCALALGAISCAGRCEFARVDASTASGIGLPLGKRIIASAELAGMIVEGRGGSVTDVDTLYLTPLPGFASRDVVGYLKIKKGHAFEVTGVRRSESSTLLCPAVYAVLRSDVKVTSRPVEIWAQLDEAEEGRFALDPDMFEDASRGQDTGRAQ